MAHCEATKSLGFAQSCGRRRSFDRARSDLCSRHQHGTCGRSFLRVAALGNCGRVGLRCVARREPVGESVGVEKLLRIGATRWLCSVHRPERSAWLDHYPRDLLAPARCADLPPAARAGGQHWPRRRAGSSQNAVLAGSDGAEAHRPVSGRRGGFAQSCGRRRSFDRGRPDPCSRHHQGRCGRFARVLSAIPAIPRADLRVASPTDERLGNSLHQENRGS
jgi:hypothetical protein